MPTGDVPHELEGDVITIGRTSDNKIQIDHTSVSAHHAKLFLINGIYKLKDLGSTNRSCINGIPISEAELVSSCFLRFGNIECVYKSEGANANDQMQSVMGDMQNQLLDFQKQKEEVSQHSRVLIKERDEAKTLAAEMSTQLNEKLKQIESITLERAVLLQSNKDLKTKLDILSAELTELKKKSERTPALQAAEQRVQELAGKLAEMQKQVDTMMRERTALLHSSTQMSTQMEALMAQVDENRSKAEQLTVFTSAAQQKIDELTRERDGYKIKLERAPSLPIRTEVTDDDLQQQIEALICERDALLEANYELKNMIEAPVAQAQEAQPQRTAFRLVQPEESVAEETVEVEQEAEPAVETEYVEEVEMPAEEPVPMVAHAGAATPLLSSWLKRAANRKVPTIQPNDSQETQQGVLNETLAVALPSASPVAAKAGSSAVLKNRAVTTDVSHRHADVKQALEALNGMRRTLHYFLRNQKDTKVLQELSRNANDLFAMTHIVELNSTEHLALALKSLLNDLNNNTQNINPSSLRTVGQAIDFFATLLDDKNLSRIHDVSESKIFALDDDTGILETISATMETVKLKVDTCWEPLVSLEKLAEQNYGMILLDVGLPQMNGLDVCARVRSLPHHKNTPIVFLTGAATVQNRVQSTLSGGNDLIGKPFSTYELAVKVLTWIYKGQMGLT